MTSSGLGRGLGSLIPNKQDPQPINNLQADLPANGNINKAPLDLIKTNPRQPRSSFNEANLEELVSSIKEYGIIQPLVVNKTAEGYELIAGERRLRAAKLAGLREVPIVVREAGEQKKLELALIENIQRQDLNPVELAIAYKQLADEFSLSQEQLAKRLGKSRPAVANTLRILNLPGEIQLALVNGEITEGHAKILVGLDSEEKQFELFRRIKARRLKVDETILESRRMGGTKQARVMINREDQDKELVLSHFFGTKATIRRGRRGGQVIVNFYNEEELDGLLDKLN
ncbi:MAG: ParB/RepB/Spo0J family partition protein [Patescibacteria group bacterium]|nr:MAG: ParB/RepB/Spo0J family partition protein [Patescibacteria group bacterium]